jgi:large subunit ribosomal protein L3
MNISVFATKIGMTQIFQDTLCIPVTVLKINRNQVLNKLYYKKKNKYNVQLGYEPIKDKYLSNSSVHFFTNQHAVPYKYIKEFAVNKKTFDAINVGDIINANDLKSSQYVKISGVSIGKGFAGVMKKHNFSGAPASHGTHEYFRHGGSIGCSTKPGRVFKGKKMPGQLGNKMSTFKNLKIVKHVENSDFILLKGQVPGYANSIVCLKVL